MKPKVLIVGSNPSTRSPDFSPFHPSTRSRKVVDEWFKDIDAELSFMNIINEKRPNNKPLTRKDTESSGDSMIARLESYKDHRIVALGKTAESVLKTAGVEHFAGPHPSGLNRKLNDPEYVKGFVGKLKEYVQNKKAQ